MKSPQLVVHANGDLQFRDLALPFRDVLVELPQILKIAANDARARERLLPDAYDDEERNEDWRRHSTPETEHLFCAARDLVELDILKMELQGKSTAMWRMRIAAEHHRAWMTSLNGARLALGVIYRVTEEDLDDRGALSFDSASERDAAILKIRLLGWLEELLVHATE